MKNKKILSILAASTIALGVAGCKKDDGITFEEYLENQETYTAAKLDADLGAINLDRETYLTALGITDTKATVTMGDVSVNTYLWEETEAGNKFLYVAGPFAEGGQSAAFKVNLSTIDWTVNFAKEEALSNPMVSGLLADTNESGKVEISEIINNYLTAMGMDTTTFNLDSILAKVDFDINDFESKGNGVYELKLTSLVDLMEDITGQDLGMTEDQINAMKEKLKIEFTYSKNHVQKIAVDFKAVEESEYTDLSTTTNTKLTFNFEYVNDSVTKTTVDSVVTTSYVDGTQVVATNYTSNQVVYGENEISLSVKSGETATDIDSDFSFSIKNENAKTTVKTTVASEDVTMLDMTVAFIGNWISEGSITINAGEMGTYAAAIESNVNVTIPTATKDLEAIDMTQTLMENVSGLLAGQMG